ncbi:hypothetical protein [Caulobacter sp. DWR2-3-1b2]|uniref:hypothetical protein n=1 Tax=unclassified Caulobacter TaxID=2648921 RepID=UPI003CE86AD3
MIGFAIFQAPSVNFNIWLAHRPRVAKDWMSDIHPLRTQATSGLDRPMEPLPIDLSDERWGELQSAFRRSYDVRPALRRLASRDAAVWDEFWEELHHQGDVGEASYAAIPAIVRIYTEQAQQPDWNVYALAATIEEARHGNDNPAIPPWLAANYDLGWADLEARALAELPPASDDALVSSILAVLALAKGKRTLARMALLTEDERKEMLDSAGWG